MESITNCNQLRLLFYNMIQIDSSELQSLQHEDLEHVSSLDISCFRTFHNYNTRHYKLDEGLIFSNLKSHNFTAHMIISCLNSNFPLEDNSYWPLTDYWEVFNPGRVGLRSVTVGRRIKGWGGRREGGVGA